MSAKRRISLRTEPQPAAEILKRIAAMEKHTDENGQRDMEGMSDMDHLAAALFDMLPGPVHGYSPSLPPDGPTDHEPGSAGKIEVMQHRVRMGMSLFHADDSRKVCPPEKLFRRRFVDDDAPSLATIFRPNEEDK